MYYTGSKSECEAYNTKVVKGEKYSGSTLRWANVRKRNLKDEYAILAHSKYTSTLNSMESLPSDWHKSSHI
tara:strand:+ start:975 stop:1187 length:213 start_codon:yes stop_codon:yes gene_type:complete